MRPAAENDNGLVKADMLVVPQRLKAINERLKLGIWRLVQSAVFEREERFTELKPQSLS
jgi:hypothetical protein